MRTKAWEKGFLVSVRKNNIWYPISVFNERFFLLELAYRRKSKHSGFAAKIENMSKHNWTQWNNLIHPRPDQAPAGPWAQSGVRGPPWALTASSWTWSIGQLFLFLSSLFFLPFFPFFYTLFSFFFLSILSHFWLFLEASSRCGAPPRRGALGPGPMGP